MSTVSRVLTGNAKRYRISAETKERVLKTARELKYRPNQLARGLRLRKTHTIGLVVPDISNPFFSYIIKTIQNSAHALGYSIVVCDTDEDVTQEVEHTQFLGSKGVDGLIVFPVGQKHDHLDPLVKNRVPLVLVDRVFDDLKASAVVVDNYKGAFEATDHLVKNGHTRIAIIQGMPDTYTSYWRHRGYEDALRDHALEPDSSLVVGKDFRQENGYIETKVLLGLSERPTAIFATSDLIALGSLQAIYEEGLNVPDDVSIVAFDDFDSAPFFRCPITAVSQPKGHMGEIAVRFLLEQIENPKSTEPRRTVLKPRLIIRESVKRVLQASPVVTLHPA